PVRAPPRLPLFPYTTLFRSGDGSGGAGDAPVAVPTRASVFPGLTPELAIPLDELLGPLVPPELSGPAHAEALAVLDVHRLGLARDRKSTRLNSSHVKSSYAV